MTQTQSLNQKAYEHICGQIMAGKLSAEQRVSEHHFARELDMSRTPVREAIRRLTREGMFYQVPRSGTYLAAPSRKRIREGYEMRIELEALAVGKAVDRLTEAQAREVSERAEQMRRAARGVRDAQGPDVSGDLLAAFVSGDVGFHLLILKAADNRLIYETVSQLLLQKHAISFPSGGGAAGWGRLARVWGFHERIVRAIRRRDADAARHWMRAHLSDSCRRALEGIDQPLGRVDASAGPSPALDLGALLGRLIDQGGASPAQPEVVVQPTPLQTQTNARTPAGNRLTTGTTPFS